MSEAGARSRRDLIATITGGAFLGAIWGAAFPIVATERRPTIAVVGHHHAQIALIDTSSARVLVMSGEPDDDLLDTLPAMLTVFRQRIDLIVASPEVLTQHAPKLRDRWRIRHAIALAGTSAQVPMAMPTTVVDSGVDVRLDDATNMMVRMGHRRGWIAGTGASSSALWCLTLDTSAGNIAVVPNVASVAAIGPPPATLLIAPDAPAPELQGISPAAALAVNYDSDSIRTMPGNGPALTRIYPVDVARFVIGEGGIELPEWTKVFDAEESR